MKKKHQSLDKILYNYMITALNCPYPCDGIVGTGTTLGKKIPKKQKQIMNPN